MRAGEEEEEGVKLYVMSVVYYIMPLMGGAAGDHFLRFFSFFFSSLQGDADAFV